MQESLFPCEGCKALRAKVEPTLQRLEHAEKVIDAALHYVESTPTQKPVLTGSMKEMIFAYNRAHGRTLNG